MNFHGYLLVKLVLFSVLSNSVYAIECYTCSSDENADCENPKKNSDKIKAQTCNPKLLAEQSGNWLKDLTKLDFFQSKSYQQLDIPMQCQKIVATLGDQRQVYRSCQLDGGSTNPCTIYEDKAAKDGIEIEHCSTCQDNLCNTASRQRTTNHFFLLLTVIFSAMIVFTRCSSSSL